MDTTSTATLTENDSGPPAPRLSDFNFDEAARPSPQSEKQFSRNESRLPEQREPKLYSYPVRRVDELLTLDPSQRVPMLSDEKGVPLWFKGTTAFVVGGGGVGKSRWVKSLAVSDIVGRDFCGFKTHGAGSWLILSTEDDEFRQCEDVRRITSGWDLSGYEEGLLHEKLNLLAHGMDSPMPPTNLDDFNVVTSLRALAAGRKPDVVVVDPWEAFISGGDVNDAPATRRSLDLLADIFRGATIVVVHHSREGAAATKGALGWDASASVKGSKTASTMARFIVNLTQKSSNLDADAPHGLVISCGKNNNGKRFAVRAVEMGGNGVYRVDESFDPQSYLANVDGKRKEAVTLPQLLDAVRSGLTKSGEIAGHVHDTFGGSRARVYDKLRFAVENGYLTKAKKGEYTLGPKADSVPPLA